MSGLLGLAAALSYGLGDFLGGALSRRVPTLTLVTLGQGAALLVLLPVSLLSSSTISAAALGWGAAAGLAGAAGSYCFLRGFAAGRLAVVTPAAAVTASGLPVLADLARGIVPATLTALGVALALIAVALVGARDPARPDSAARSPSAASPTGGTGLAWGLGAGTAHAAMYVLLGLAPPDAGPWPATALFLALVALAVTACLARHAPPRAPARQLPAITAIGALSAAGTLAYLYAAGAGSVGVAAVTTELSPIITALLARLALAEPIPPLRALGLTLAVLAGIFISLG